MTVNDVFQWLNSIAPFETQDEYDNAGLITGRPDAPAGRVLFVLDATRAAVAQASAIGAELIVAHHPLMFSPIKQLLYDQGEGAVLQALAASGISLIAAHTNLDICAGGVADSLAEILSLQDIRPSAACPYLRAGTLQTPMAAKDFLAYCNRSLSAAARLYGDPQARIQSVAVVPGAGGAEHAHAHTDAFVTGEIKHHELLAAVDRGLTVIDAGHYPTEFPGVAALYRRFQAEAAQRGWAAEARLFTRAPYPCMG